MSDKIQSDYTEYMKKAEPSEEFLSQLVQTLEDEQARPKRTGLRRPGAAPAAACLVLILGLSAALYMQHRQEAPAEGNASSMPEEINNYAATMPDEDIRTTPFSGGGWRDGIPSDESAPLALARKLSLSLDYLVCSNENRFVDAETVDGATAAQIAELLRSAEPVGGEGSGQRIYYMAVFTDGTIAKFNITDDGCIEIDGDNTVYQKKEK